MGPSCPSCFIHQIPKNLMQQRWKTSSELPQMASCSENSISAEKSVSTCERRDESVCARRPPTAAPTVDLWKYQASNEGKLGGDLGEAGGEVVLWSSGPSDRLKPRFCSPGLLLRCCLPLFSPFKLVDVIVCCLRLEPRDITWSHVCSPRGSCVNDMPTNEWLSALLITTVHLNLAAPLVGND